MNGKWKWDTLQTLPRFTRLRWEKTGLQQCEGCSIVFHGEGVLKIKKGWEAANYVQRGTKRLDPMRADSVVCVLHGSELHMLEKIGPV